MQNHVRASRQAGGYACRAMKISPFVLSFTLISSHAIAAESAAPVRLERLTFVTRADAGQPSVALDPGGGFIVTWQERASASASLWYAALDRNGRETRRGRIAAGKNWVVNWADFPSLAVLANGDWVTHYFERSGDSPHAYDIRVVRSTDRGATWSKPVTPHKDGTATEHGFVSLVPLQADRVLAVWLDGRHTTGAHAGRMTLRSAVLHRAGTLTEERQLDDSVCDCCQTDAARFTDGRAFIAYRDRSQDEIRDISVIERSDQGAWSAPRTVHADGWKIEGCPVNGPALAVNGSRVFTVWPTQARDTAEVRYTLGDANAPGHARTLAAGAGTLGRVDAARWGDGFLVTFLGAAGGTAGLQLAQIDGDGRIVWRQTVASVTSTRMSGNPRLASTGEHAVLAWIEPDPGKKGHTVALALLRGERQR
jgi:hypothetical protein